jgi:hypothetical protein
MKGNGMKTFSSNRELYDYLLSLSSELKQRGAAPLSEAVEFAMAQASSSSTEFIGESRIALRRVLREEHGVLSDSQLADLSDAIKQLDAAIDGGVQ